jgi:hypothetical protein
MGTRGRVTRPRRDHRLRPGRAGRHRLRRAARPWDAAVEAGGPLGEVESTKSVSEIYAPVAGTVTAINESLSANPEQINQDPYGEGWICELELADVAALAGSPRPPGPTGI